MDDFKLNHKALLLVCDGAKALFLRNDGTAMEPRLSVERELGSETPARTAEMGTDRPGRTTNAAGPTSAMEQTDFHTREEEAFLLQVIAEFDAHCREKDVKQVVIAAPARALAVIRTAVSKELMGRCVGQLAKDYVNHPVGEIARLVAM